MEILEMVGCIVNLIPEDKVMLQRTGYFILADAMKISTKITGAKGGDLYDIRMENAVIWQGYLSFL